jgi:hypothetical protein
MVNRDPVGAALQPIVIGKTDLDMTAGGLAMAGNARARIEDTRCFVAVFRLPAT